MTAVQQQAADRVGLGLIAAWRADEGRLVEEGIGAMRVERSP